MNCTFVWRELICFLLFLPESFPYIRHGVFSGVYGILNSSRVPVYVVEGLSRMGRLATFFLWIFAFPGKVSSSCKVSVIGLRFRNGLNFYFRLYFIVMIKYWGNLSVFVVIEHCWTVFRALCGGYLGFGSPFGFGGHLGFNGYFMYETDILCGICNKFISLYGSSRFGWFDAEAQVQMQSIVSIYFQFH